MSNSPRVDTKTTAEQVRSILNLSGIVHGKRWQMLLKIAHDICKEFFQPEWQWKDISNHDVEEAREAMQKRDPLLHDRPDVAHWMLLKCQRSTSYQHRQRLERSAALEPFIADSNNSEQASADTMGQDQDVDDTDAGKRFDAVRNEWV